MLGPPEILRDGRVVPIGGPKQQALLVLFLLRPNRYVSADWLVDALWDGRPPASAEMTLRTYVAGLRRAVEPQRSPREPARVLLSRSKGYELRVPVESIDAVRFDRLLGRAADAFSAGDPATAERCYTEALALWRGEPLAGVAELTVVRPEAVRLTELRLGAEEGRFTAALADGVSGGGGEPAATGRHASLLTELGRFVSANPAREGARAQLMLALYRRGRQTEALAVFDEGRRILADEYGLDPGEQLREAHRLILDQAVPSTPTPRATPDPTPTPTPTPTVAPPRQVPTSTLVPPGPVPFSTIALSSPAPSSTVGSSSPAPFSAVTPPDPNPTAAGLVGRGAELDRLTETLGVAIRRAGRVATVVGDPGIGKTSLATALGELARADGVPVVWGRCPDVGQAPPFWLWSQVVRELVAMPEAEPIASAHGLGVFALDPPAGPAEESGPDPTARFRAYEAVSALVRTVARRRGLLIVLDDLHAADPDSLLLLRYLSSLLAGSRALVVATLRPYGHDAALVATVAELARGPGFSQLPVTGLDASSVADLVRDRTGVPPPERVVARLVTRTGGNPFFITELLRARTDPATGELPPSIRDTVRLRLGGLPGAARDCLDLLSVAGHALELRVMATVLDTPAAQVADGLATAYTAALLIEAGPGSVGFRHPLFAEVTYAELPPPRRAALHARLAVGYERAGDVAPAELAHHYGQAIGLGHGDDHLRWSLLAADDATRRVAYEDALGHLDRAARRLAPTADVSPRAAQTELRVQLRRAALLQMTAGVGSDAVDQVCARARDLLALVGPEADVRSALWVLGEVAANRAEFEICVDIARRLVRAEDDGTGLIAVAGEYLLGVVAYLAGRLAEAEHHLGAAVDGLRAVDPGLLGEQIGRRPVLAAYNFRALVRSLRGDAAGGRADIAAAETLAEELADPYGRANAALFAGWMGLQERDVPAVRAAAGRCREIGRDSGLPHFVTTGAFFTEWVAARSGDPGRLPAMRAAGDAIYRLGLRSTRTITVAAMAEAYLAAGDPTTALALADEGLAVAERTGERVLVAELYRVRGLAGPDPADLDTGSWLAAEQGAGMLLARFPTEDR